MEKFNDGHVSVGYDQMVIVHLPPMWNDLYFTSGGEMYDLLRFRKTPGTVYVRLPNVNAPGIGINLQNEQIWAGRLGLWS